MPHAWHVITHLHSEQKPGYPLALLYLRCKVCDRWQAASRPGEQGSKIVLQPACVISELHKCGKQKAPYDSTMSEMLASMHDLAKALTGTA